MKQSANNKDYVREKADNHLVEVKCNKCGATEDLTENLSILFLMGLHPFKCKGCKRLTTASRFPELVNYMKGWQ